MDRPAASSSSLSIHPPPFIVPVSLLCLVTQPPFSPLDDGAEFPEAYRAIVKSVQHSVTVASTLAVISPTVRVTRTGPFFHAPGLSVTVVHLLPRTLHMVILPRALTRFL